MYGIFYLVLDFDINAVDVRNNVWWTDVRNWVMHPTNLETCIPPKIILLENSNA